MSEQHVEEGSERCYLHLLLIVLHRGDEHREELPASHMQGRGRVVRVVLPSPLNTQRRMRVRVLPGVNI